MATIGNAVYAASSLATAVILARLGSTELLGAYALTQSICAPIFFVSGLGIINIVSTDAKGEFTAPEYFATRLLGNVPAFLTVLILAGLLTPGYSGFVVAAALMSLAFSVDSLYEVYVGYFRCSGNLRDPATIRIVNGLVSLVLIGCATGLSDSLTLVAGAYLGGSTVAFFWAVRLANRQFPGLASPSQIVAVSPLRLKLLITTAAPLGVSGTISLLNTHFPRYVLAKTGGAADVGVYTAAAQPMLVAGVIVTSMAESVIGDLSRKAEAGDRQGFQSVAMALAKVAALVSTVGMIIIWSFSEQIVTTLYGRSYVTGASTLIILGAAVGVRTVAAVLGTIFSAIRRFDLNWKFKLLGLGVGATLCMPLAIRFGAKGAAYAVLSGAIVEALVGVAIYSRVSAAIATNHLVQSARPVWGMKQ